jgi:hypothetical protein
MVLVDRQVIMRNIEVERSGRTLICFFNFDRDSFPPGLIPGLATQFLPDTKEPLFRVLKESTTPSTGIDLCFYTRGGDINAVWPLASLIREFDPDFEVLIPFRCHSSGTLLALGARKIIMAPIAELSPIDPSTGNQFNPSDPTRPLNRLAISVEDVQQYRNFILDQFKYKIKDDVKDTHEVKDLLASSLDRLTDRVHPLALGNVHRVQQQIKILAKKLLDFHPVKGRNVDVIIEALTTRFYSHLHMINRYEAQEILGADRIDFASNNLAKHLDILLRNYEDTFLLRKSFFINEHLQDNLQQPARFIGGAIESKTWSYLFETKALLRQQSAVPPNIQIQLPPGQPMQLIQGLPRQYNVEVTSQGWIHNIEPKGVTV